MAGAAFGGASALISRPAPVQGTVHSPEALAAAVLDAFQRGDRSALERLAISEQEFADHVWPALPAARPERNLTASFVWADLSGKSRQYLATNLKRPLPPGARAVAITFEGDTSRYGTITIRRQSVITLTDAGGHSTKARLFGSMLEQNGRYKVFSYVTD